jgi:hypothetical protein
VKCFLRYELTTENTKGHGTTLSILFYSMLSVPSIVIKAGLKEVECSR